jgi:PAS domain S-box-containing protein
MIVVVDDDAECRAAVTGILKSEGLNVRAADSGDVALAVIALNSPELILLDIGMPGLDGFEVCRRIKANEKTRDIPVVFLSEASDTEERVTGLRLGASDFISKPFEREVLLARVRTHLELGRLRRDIGKQVAERTAELRTAKEVLEFELAERARTEAILRKREADFCELADRAPMGVWVMGADQRLLFHNKRGLKLGGRTKHQLMGDGWTKIVHPDDLSRVQRNYAMAVKERRSFRIECRVRGPKGSIRWVLNTGIPRFVGRKFAGHIGTTVDITNLKRSQERMIMSEKLESLEYLTAGIAHDFNNLVTSIFVASDLALADLPTDSPARVNIERITAVANRASEIVSLLMAYAGEYGGQIAQIDLSRVAGEMVELLRGTASPRIVLHANLASGLPKVHANVTQVRQVILNLIMNAFEALGSTEGVVQVTTDRTRIGRTNPERGTPVGEYCRIVVADTGCGMSSSVQAKIFDPFYSTKFIGRGLGLAVVHGIIRSLGGVINITTAPGKGSTFEVLLPCGGYSGIGATRLLSAAAGGEFASP